MSWEGVVMGLPLEGEKILFGASISMRAVQQHRMPLGHFFKNVPDLRRLALNHLFRAAHCVHVTEVFQPADNEWLEKHERHLLWQTALVQLQLRTNDNHRAA